jgi:hypothetical protein
MMGFLDFLSKLSPLTRAAKFNGFNEFKRDERPGEDTPVTTKPDGTLVLHPPVSIPDIAVRETIPAEPTANGLPQRYGTFLVVDLYPGDLKGKPDWRALEKNSKIGNCEVVGAILKATEGISYRYTPWFIKSAETLNSVWADRRGKDRFIGAYHFLQLARDGKKQAEYFVKTMDQGGLLYRGDIRPMLDFEQGGQYNFFPTDCPKDAEGRYRLDKLPDAKKREIAKRAMETTRTCAEKIYELTSIRPMFYGRGLLRDLAMRTDRGYTVEELRMGCVGAVNPAYTKEIPPMDQYGWPIETVGLWQYGGDGVAAHPKLPNAVPGFGAVDLNVHIDGSRRTSLESFRKALVIR